MSVVIIAHRGESYDTPENTLTSINLAWEWGAAAVEIDIHLSSDKKVVVIHDSTTKRTGNVNKKVNQLTVSELKRLDAGSWKNKKFVGEKIPTLKEVLKTVQPGKKLIIEIKSNNKILEYLKKEIADSKLEINQIEIISFSYSTVKMAKKMLPEHNVLYLADLDYSWFTGLISLSTENLIKKVQNSGLDGLNVWAGKMLDQEFVDKVKAADLLLYVWTVNDLNQAKKLVDMGIDGITTDRAQWMRDHLF